MPGFLLHVGATVLCSHAGQARPAMPNPRVTVGGQPTVALPGPWLVTACPLPPSSGGPCVTAQFVTAATRVSSNGQPLLLFDSQAVCAPTGSPLLAVASQAHAAAI